MWKHVRAFLEQRYDRKEITLRVSSLLSYEPETPYVISYAECNSDLKDAWDG